jgi:cell division protein FtsL
MSDQRIIQLLEEIRDIGKQNAENYKLALARQEEALQLQKKALGRVRTVIMAVMIVLILMVAVPVISWGSGWLAYCLRR